MYRREQSILSASDVAESCNFGGLSPNCVNQQQLTQMAGDSAVDWPTVRADSCGHVIEQTKSASVNRLLLICAAAGDRISSKAGLSHSLVASLCWVSN